MAVLLWVKRVVLVTAVRQRRRAGSMAGSSGAGAGHLPDAQVGDEKTEKTPHDAGIGRRSGTERKKKHENGGDRGEHKTQKRCYF